MKQIPRPIVPPTEVRVLSHSEIRQLLDTCRSKSLEDRRDLAILMILLDTGIRISELAGLTVEDIGFDKTIRVFGKGRKWRTAALGTGSSTALDRWLRARGEASGSLWTGRKGPLTVGGLRRMVVRRGQQIGVDLHPHMLRHTFVDNWLRNGGAEVDLAKLCGWTSIRMTEKYARFHANERAVVAHKSIAPLDKLL